MKEMNFMSYINKDENHYCFKQEDKFKGENIMTMSVGKKMLMFLLLVFAFSMQAIYAQSPVWEKIDVTYSPSARSEHSMAFDSGRNVGVMFGGFGASGRYYETWEFNGSEWKQISTANRPNGSGPNSLVYDSNRQKIVYFGGYNGTDYLNDTWEYDGTNWTKISTANSPTKRYAAALVYDPVKQKTILFGGYGQSPANPALVEYLNDTWEYDGVNWAKITTATKPVARSHHTIAYDNNRKTVVMFGGKNANNDLWEYLDGNWVKVAVTNTNETKPQARYAHSMVYDFFHKKLVMYGGFSFGTYYDEVWEFQTDTWTKVPTVKTPGFPYQGSLMWSYDTKRLYYFGGRNATVTSNETWYFTEDKYASGDIFFTRNGVEGIMTTLNYYGTVEEAVITVADYNLPDTPQTVTVRVTSDDDPVGFDMTLKNTGYAGVYSSESNGQNLYFTTSVSDPVYKYIKVSDKKKFRASYSYAYKGIIITTEAIWNLSPEKVQAVFDKPVYQGLDEVPFVNVSDYNFPNNLSQNDQLTVKITSDLDPIGFEINCLELEPKAGIFSNRFSGDNITFTLDASDPLAKKIKVAHGAKVYAEYTPINLPTVKAEAVWEGFPATIGWDKDTYLNLTAKANITLNEPEKNLNPTAREAAVVHLTSDDDPDGFYATLWETDVNTGIFSTTTFAKPIGFSGVYSDPINQVLRVKDGNTIYASYEDEYPVQVFTDTAIWKQKSNSFITMNRDYYVNEKLVKVTLVSDDLNMQSDVAETVEVSAKTSSDLVGISLSLQEDGPNSGYFTGSFNLAEAVKNTIIDIEGISAAASTLLVTDGDDVIVQTPDDSAVFGTPLKDIATYVTYTPQLNESYAFIVDGPEEDEIVAYSTNITYRLTAANVSNSPGGVSSYTPGSFDYYVKLQGVDPTWRKIDNDDAVTGNRVIYPSLPDGEYRFFYRVKLKDDVADAPLPSYFKMRRFYVNEHGSPKLKPPKLTYTIPTNGQIQLNWFPVEGATQYNIYRRNMNEGPFYILNDDQTLTSTLFIDNNNPQKDTPYEYYITAVNTATGVISISNLIDLVNVDQSNKSGTIKVNTSQIDFGKYQTDATLILDDITVTPVDKIKWVLSSDCPYISFSTNYGSLEYGPPYSINIHLDRTKIPEGAYPSYYIYLRSSAQFVDPVLLQNNGGIIKISFTMSGPVSYSYVTIPHYICGGAQFPYWADYPNNVNRDKINSSRYMIGWGEGNKVPDPNERVSWNVLLKNTGTVSANSVSAFVYEEDPLLTLTSGHYMKYNEIAGGGTSPSSGFQFLTSQYIPELRNGYDGKFYFLCVDNLQYQWVSSAPVVVYNVKPIYVTRFEIDDDNIGGSKGNANELIDINEQIEARISVFNDSLYPFSNLKVKLNAQTTDVVDNYHYCEYDTLLSTRFRDIFFTSNYPSIFMTIDFGNRESTYIGDNGLLDSKETYSLSTDNQDIEFRTFTYWAPSPYNYYAAPVGSEQGGYFEKNPMGEDTTKNYQNEEMIFQVEVEGTNTFNDGIYRRIETFYENPYVETLFEDDFSSHSSTMDSSNWSNKWISYSSRFFDPIDFTTEYDNLNSISMNIEFFETEMGVGKFGFYTSPISTWIANDDDRSAPTVAPFVNGYYIPSDPTAYAPGEESTYYSSPTYLYRAGFLVSTDSPSTDKAPAFRFRASTLDMQQINSLEINSTSSGNCSPAKNEKKEYSLIFNPHYAYNKFIPGYDRIALSFDIMNFDPEDTQTGKIKLHKVRVDRVAMYKLRDWEDVVTYDFSFGTQDWVTAPLDTVARNVVYSYENEGLKITTPDPSNAFGFWNSPVEAFTLDPNRLYRAVFSAKSTEPEQYYNPAVRFRMGTSNSQMISQMIVNNNQTDPVNNEPSTCDFDLSSDVEKDYPVYMQPPGVITYSTENKGFAAFDLLGFSSVDIGGSGIVVPMVRVQKTKHIRWNTFDYKPNMNLLRHPGFEGNDSITKDMLVKLITPTPTPSPEERAKPKIETLKRDETTTPVWQIECVTTANGADIVIDAKVLDFEGWMSEPEPFLYSRYNDLGYNQRNWPFDPFTGQAHSGDQCLMLSLSVTNPTGEDIKEDVIVDIKIKQKINLDTRLRQWIDAVNEDKLTLTINDLFQSGFYFAANNRNYGTRASTSSGSSGEINMEFVRNTTETSTGSNLLIWNEISPFYEIPEEDPPFGNSTDKKLPYFDTARYFKELWQYKRIGEYKTGTFDLDPEKYWEIPFNKDPAPDTIEFIIHVYLKCKPTKYHTGGYVDPFIIYIDNCELRLRNQPTPTPVE